MEAQHPAPAAFKHRESAPNIHYIKRWVDRSVVLNVVTEAWIPFIEARQSRQRPLSILAAKISFLHPVVLWNQGIRWPSTHLFVNKSNKIK
jgi:hypothetical protein